MSDILPQVQIGHSALFRTIDGLRKWLSHSVEPVELVFPGREDEYLPLLEQMDSIATCAAGHKPGVLSIHAPPLRLEGADFVEKALLLAGLAERLGARTITLHPTKCRRGHDLDDLQRAAMENLRQAQALTNVTLTVETLGHKRCLFNEEEIIGLGLPMVLDTTHVGWETSHELLRRYGASIPTIHLSERTPESHHQRIGRASFDFIAHALDAGWQGSVVLEYWPWRWRCYADDVPALSAVAASCALGGSARNAQTAPSRG